MENNFKVTMIQKIKNWFNVKPTGSSFWDGIGCQTVYTFEYIHSGDKFLATSRYSLFRVDIGERKI